MLDRLFRASRASADARRDDDIICLAFSRKYQGRCFAGLRRSDGGWVRPVSAQPEGTLSQRDYQLPGRRSPALLNVIHVPLGRPKPEAHQPENRMIANGAWSLISERPDEADWEAIDARVERTSLLFGTATDRVPYANSESRPAEASLSLVAPDAVRFLSASNYSGYPQARLWFRLGGNAYRLAVTDPDWERRILDQPEGEYSPRDFAVDLGRLRLTLSLGEPFQGQCYKLVAAIFEVN